MLRKLKEQPAFFAALYWALAFGGLVAWVMTLWGEPFVERPRVLLNYAALVACCVGSAALIHHHWVPWRFFRYTTPAAVLLALMIYAPLDRYTTTWTRVWDEEKLEWRQTPKPIEYTDSFPQADYIVCRDTHKRWSGRHLYREMDYWGSDARLVCIYEGPMIGRTKPHGEWTLRYMKPPYKVEREWFWYGEEISEGEWHLRNK